MNPSRTVLLVDDSENDLLLLEAAFEKAHFECLLRKVYDGEQAISYLKGEGSFADRGQNPMPDLVLLDLNMPKKNGFEVLRWVRARPELSRIPLIVLTASLRSEDVDLACELFADSFLVKPASLQELMAMVGTLEGWLRINHLPPRNGWVRR